MVTKNNKLGLVPLSAMCVGSMIGAGLFDLPQNVAHNAGVVALLIAWAITFLGMLCLARVFQNLSMRCPELDVGIYAYAKAGLGDYLGFNSAWGYWISVWVGNAGYIIVLCAALSLFFPLFGDGTSLLSLAVSSLIIWVVTYLCVRGIKSATLVNTVITIIKVVPIIIFILIIAYAFNPQIFAANVLQPGKLGSVAGQVKGMMLITVWLFIGIEGASVFSAWARDRRDVGKATIISFLIMFVVLFAISLLPFGILPQEGIAALKNPSTGALLAHSTGVLGNAFINIALVISILGAFLSWVLIAAEVPFFAGKRDGLFPKIFVLENKVNFPIGALIITAVCEQLYLVFAYFYQAGYLPTISLAVAMILPPYLFSAFYALLLAATGKTYEKVAAQKRFWDFLISMVAVAYGVWLLYSAGKYLLLSSVLYFIGGVIYIANKIWRRQKVFNKYELILFLVLGLASVISVVALINGQIKLS